MSEQFNDIDKKLKQLEQQSLPDLSHQDEHWKKMQGLIDQNPSDRKSFSDRNPWIWIAGSLLLTGLVYVGNQFFQNKKKPALAISADAAIKAIDTTGKDSIVLYAVSAANPRDTFRLLATPVKTPAPVLNIDPRLVALKDTIILYAVSVTAPGDTFKLLANTVKTELQLVRQSTPVNNVILAAPVKNNSVNSKPLSFTPAPQKSLPVKNSVSVHILNTIDTGVLTLPAPVKRDSSGPVKKQTLDEFFGQLKKPAQTFSIENNKDNLLTGKDGSVLFIPAGTFETKDRITISLTEYYTYGDIITNQLSTCSDGQPLITGGMIRLTAMANGKEIEIRPDRAIRWFIPDTTVSMKEMSLFEGNTANRLKRKPNLELKMDTIGNQKDQGQVNWIPQEQLFTTTYLTTSVKVLDLRNEPYQTKTTRKGEVGKFWIAPDTKIPADTLKARLINQYGYYKVRIRKQKDRNSLFTKIVPRFLRRNFKTESWQSLGDSAWVSPEIARSYRLKATDTIIYRTSGIGQRFTGLSDTRGTEKFDTVFSNSNLNNLAKRYSVDIRSLGWINCDRFYRDNAPRADYIVNLGDTAANYYSLLVFEQLKSMIPGMISGNLVIFPNIPLGLKAKVISVGIRDGKPVAAMENVTVSRKQLEGLKFEETSVPAFKEQVAVLDR